MNSLDNVILLCCCIAEVYMLFDLFHNFFPFREGCGKRKITIISIVTVFSLYFVNSFGNAIFNLIFVVILFWIYVTLLFKAPLGQRILNFTVSFSIFWGCEFLFVIIMEIPTYLLKQSSVIDLSEMPWQMFTMKMLNYLLFSFVKQFSDKSKGKMAGKIFAMYICLPIVSFVMMILTYYSGIAFTNQPGMKILMTICCGLMLIGNILIFYAFNKYSEELYNNFQQRMIISRQEMRLSHYTQLKEVDSKHDELIHNFSHYLKVIGELLKENELKSIEKLIKNLNIDLEETTTIVYSNNLVLNAILNDKKACAERENVVFEAYVEPWVNMEKIVDVDLINMLDNLLDNAIRAAKECEEDKRKVSIKIFMQNEGSFCVAKVTNHFREKVEINADGEFLSTKKEEGIHGIGIKSVRKAAEKYGGYLECFAENQIFTSILVL